MKYKELDVVRTLIGFPEECVNKGDIGTIIVAFMEPGEAYEIEFDDGTGRPKASVVILPEHLELVYASD